MPIYERDALLRPEHAGVPWASLLHGLLDLLLQIHDPLSVGRHALRSESETIDAELPLPEYISVDSFFEYAIDFKYIDGVKFLLTVTSLRDGSLLLCHFATRSNRALTSTHHGASAIIITNIACTASFGRTRLTGQHRRAVLSSRILTVFEIQIVYYFSIL